MGLKLIFMGTPEFGVPTLEALIEAGHDVACVYSQPPRPAGRGKADRLSPVHDFAAARGIEVRTPTSLKDPKAVEDFAAVGADAAVVVAYGLILPKGVLEAPRLGCLNLHASLLPRWRGAAPIQRAVMAGDKETGVCVMQMDEGLDTGAVLDCRSVAIPAEMTAGELHDALSVLGAPLLVDTLDRLAEGRIEAAAQPEEGVTYAAKIDKAEARLDWTRSAAELDRHIRGLAPFPGAWFSYAGERIKVLGATVIDAQGAAGRTLNGDLTIACGDGALKLTTVQRGGKKPMPATELVRGFPVPAGADLTR